MFDKSIYVERRKTLLSKLQQSGEKGIAIFLGNVDASAQYVENCYKFRQNSSWLYYFGIDEPRFAAIIDLESGDETIFADDFEIDDIIWMGPMPSVASLAAGVGVEHTAPYGAFSVAVIKAVTMGRPVHFLPVARYYNAQKIASLLGLDPMQIFSEGKKGCAKASLPLVKAVVEQRLVKSAEEIASIEAACDLGQQMHRIARRGIRLGAVEQDIVGAMEGHALAKGWGLSFPTILTQHGEIFHCHDHSGVLQEGRLLVVDAGVEANDHYASDFTRTYPTSGKFTSRQRDIYQTVYECNELAFQLTKPGVSYYDVHQGVAAKMLSNLKDLGLVQGNVDDMMEIGIAGLFQPHGLGHNMGLDVHDMEDLGENLVGYDDDQSRSPLLGLGSLRMARRLVAGNIVTDEPGIYFIPDLIRLWKAEKTDRGFVNYDKLEEFLDFGGIRLEDDVLVTENGARRLGSDRLEIAPDDVERAMQMDKQ